MSQLLPEDRSCSWMQDCFGKLGLGDVDDFFAYETVKLVRVRDFRLGMMSYLFKLAIFLYVIVYGVVIRQGYLRLEQIQAGSVILNSQAPPSSVARPPHNLTYCCLNETWVGCPEDKLPCAYWDEHQAEFPVGKDYSTVVTSRVNITTQVANNTNDPSVDCRTTNFVHGCQYVDEGVHDSFYIANSEDFTIRVRHAIRGQVIHRTGSNVGDNPMRGKLMTVDGGVTRRWPDEDPPYPVDQSDTRSGDIVSIRELLTASNTDIDDLAPTGDSIRYDGLNVIVYINYEMVGSSNLRYTYQPRTLNDAEFKVEQTRVYDEGRRRQILNRHGVRFIFVQTGELGQFDFLTLMTTIVTGMALLAVANTITNFIMLRLLAFKDLYRAHKYEVTEDFSVWRDMEHDERKRRMHIAREVNRGGPEAEDTCGVTITEPAFLQDLGGNEDEDEAESQA